MEARRIKEEGRRMRKKEGQRDKEAKRGR